MKRRKLARRNICILMGKDRRTSIYLFKVIIPRSTNSYYTDTIDLLKIVIEYFVCWVLFSECTEITLKFCLFYTLAFIKRLKICLIFFLELANLLVEIVLIFYCIVINIHILGVIYV